MKKNKGFALIELMICVVIIAILAAVAIPAFTEKKQSVNSEHQGGSAMRASGVSEIRLKDGTPCVIYQDKITCNWGVR